MRFSREGFDAEGLDVQVDGDAARFAIAVGAHAAEAGNQVEASLRGDMKAASVMSVFHALDPYWNRLPGKAYWDLTLAVPRSPDPERPKLSLLTLTSDLRGIELDLPAPLGKDAESPMPLRMSVQLPAAGNELDVQLGAMARFKARMAENTAALMRGEVKDVDRQYRLRLRDGSWLWIEGSPRVVLGPNGEPGELVTVFRDVTHRRTVKEALKASEAKHRTIVEQMKDLVIQTNFDAEFTHVSPSVRSLGYEPEDLIGRKIDDFLHPEDAARATAESTAAGVAMASAPLRAQSSILPSERSFLAESVTLSFFFLSSSSASANC